MTLYHAIFASIRQANLKTSEFAVFLLLLQNVNLNASNKYLRYPVGTNTTRNLAAFQLDQPFP